MILELPWQSNGLDSVLPRQGVQVLSLGGELRSHVLHDKKKKKDTIKLLEENICKTFSDINHSNVFLGQSLKAVEIKIKINKQNLIKLTSYVSSKSSS